MYRGGGLSGPMVYALCYADRLKSLNLYSVQGRLMRADLIQYWKIFNGKSCIKPEYLFERPPLPRTRGHCFRIFPIHTNTDVRKRFFSVRCIAAWNSLPANVVCAPNLTLSRECSKYTPMICCSIMCDRANLGKY